MAWQIGRVKFFSKKDNFGFIYDNMYPQSAKQELYFNLQICDGYIFKTDEVVFYKTKLVASKDTVYQIFPVNKHFYEILVDELDLNAIIDSFLIIEKSYDNEIESIYTNFEKEIEKLNIEDFFKPEIFDIKNYLEDFSLKININYRHKVGDDDSLNISYAILNPHIEFISVDEFKTHIISDSGMTSPSKTQHDFIVNMQPKLEREIPERLEELKKNLELNYCVKKSWKYRGFFHLTFKQRLRGSIQRIGLNKTIENQNNIFNAFYQELVNGVGFTNFTHLSKIK